MTDDVLERVRMCIAEAGYDPMCAIEPVNPANHVRWTRTAVSYVPNDVKWKAREVAEVDEPTCRCCWQLLFPGQDPPERTCRAVRRLEFDCGVDRG